MTFTKEDLNQIKKCELAQPLTLTMGHFYVKKAQDAEDRLISYDLAINELINSFILRQVGLIAPDIYLVMPNLTDESAVYVVSSNLSDLGSFQTAEELGLTREASSSLNEIRLFLEQKYGSNPELAMQIPNLFQEIIILYGYDIFMGYWDRLGKNWGIIETDTEELALGIFDNEYHLDNFIHNISASKHGKDWYGIRQKVLFADYLDYEAKRQNAIKEDITNFYQNYGEEYGYIFDRLYQLLTPEFYEKALDYLTNTTLIYSENKTAVLEITDAAEMIAAYTKNYALITAIREEITHGRK